MLEINLTERGPPELLPIEAWREHDLDGAMRSLESYGVIKLTRTPSSVVVTPAHYVGEMYVPSAVLRIRSKAPEVLAAMDAMALKGGAKNAQNYVSESTSELSGNPDPAGSFVRALVNCIHEGFPWSYGIKTQITSYPRGRLEFGLTTRRLASRGIRHRVIATVPARIQDISLLRLVHSAHTRLPNVKGVTPRLLADAEDLIKALEPVSLFNSAEEGLAEANRLLEVSDATFGPAATELAARSAEILFGEYTTGRLTWSVPGGIARFRSVEELWERCIERMVRCVFAIFSDDFDVQLHGLRSQKMQLFPDGGPFLDPDIIVMKGIEIAAIFDAKYKRFLSNKSAIAGDLYQITAYVRRTSSKIGMVLHFSDDTDHINVVGTTPEGSQILVAAISAQLLLSEGEFALAQLLQRSPSILERFEKSFADRLRHEGGNGITNLPRNVLLGA